MNVVILAAGKGTRMKSNLPKVLHNIAGQPMLSHVINQASQIDGSAISVVIGHKGELIQDYFNDDSYDINWVWQKEQKGTGHAVKVAVDQLNNDESVMVLFGDVPLITKELLEEVVVTVKNNSVALVTANMSNPGALGRIIRDKDNNVVAIREYKDATDKERDIKEINSGILAVPGKYIRSWLAALTNDNAQGEYYLTDLIAMAVADNVAVKAVVCEDEGDVTGVNSLIDLYQAERLYQHKQAEKLLHDGCYIIDPTRLDIRGRLKHGKDCIIDVNCIIEGDCEIGDGVTIGPNCILSHAKLASHVTVLANSMIERSVVDEGSHIGPYARIRPDCKLDKNVRIGNFVELKKSHIGQFSKINHLSYIGDASVGEKVNIGAGVITCNYDGVNKHQTIIANNAFIGSDCQLVAPVVIGENATVAAGTTVIKDAPDNQLTLNNKTQSQLSNWQRPEQKE